MSSSMVDSSSENMFVLQNLRPNFVEFDDDDEEELDARDEVAPFASPARATHQQHARVRFQRPPPPTTAPPSMPRFSNAEIEHQLETLISQRALSTDSSSAGTFVELEGERQPSLASLLLRSQRSNPTSSSGAAAAAASSAPHWATSLSTREAAAAAASAPSVVKTPSPASASAAADYLAGGTIRVMQGVLAQKRQAPVAHQLRTGLPAHLDLGSSAAAMALDVLALSHETEAMNDECLRVGIWNYVPPSLMLLRDDETAKFIQIVLYLMQKNSSLMMRGLDFLLYLLGYYRAWEVKNAKEASKQSFQWTKEQRGRVFPNAAAALFEADHCDALIVAARDFMKEQSSLHVRLATLQRAFLKLYTKASGLPHWRPSNRKILKQSFDLNLNYWERQQRAQRKRF